MKHIFMINPNSGNGESVKLIQEIELYFKDKDEDYQIHVSAYPKHIIELTNQYSTKDDVCIYAVGGDGSAYEVLNGLNDCVPMAILPAGSGNDFYRMLGVKGTLKQLLKETIEGKMVTVDYAIANEKRFLNITAMGLDADVNVKTNQNKKKFIPNKLLYAYYAIIVVCKPKCIKMTIEINNQIINKELLLCAVANGRNYGGGFTPTPLACIQDQLLDICIVENMATNKILRLLPKYFKGTHVNEKAVTFFKTNQLIIKTDQNVNLSIDGEISKENKIVFKLIKDGLTLRVPKKSSLN